MGKEDKPENVVGMADVTSYRMDVAREYTDQVIEYAKARGIPASQAAFEFFHQGREILMGVLRGEITVHLTDASSGANESIELPPPGEPLYKTEPISPIQLPQRDNILKFTRQT